MTQHTRTTRTLLYVGLLFLLPACILYAALNGTSLSAQSISLSNAQVDPNCDPFEPWLQQRLEYVVMRDNNTIQGVVITNICGDFVSLETTGGGISYMVHRNHIIYIEGRPL
ncbi:hypothetical protein ACFL6U_13530 [Planctomycetota bacterium]